MNSTSLWTLFAASIACLALIGCASNSGVVQMGDNTYMVTRQAATGFSGSGTLKAKALKEATKFCESKGKKMKVVAITETKPPYILANFPKAEVVFKALDPGDPELKTVSLIDPSGIQIKVGEPPLARAIIDYNNEQLKADDLYVELSKLDELRKRGVLTDAEFETQKSKILNRSK